MGFCVASGSDHRFPSRCVFGSSLQNLATEVKVAVQLLWLIELKKLMCLEHMYSRPCGFLYIRLKILILSRVCNFSYIYQFLNWLVKYQSLIAAWMIDYQFLLLFSFEADLFHKTQYKPFWSSQLPSVNKYLKFTETFMINIIIAVFEFILKMGYPSSPEVYSSNNEIFNLFWGEGGTQTASFMCTPHETVTGN